MDNKSPQFILVLFIASFLVSFSLFAQEPTVAVELPEMNMLYRGYENKILVVVNNCDNADLEMSGSNCEIFPTEKNGEFILKPGFGGKAIIRIHKEFGDTTKLIREITYRVFNLPDPTLYWGATKSGERGALNSRLILAKYPPASPLYGNYIVKQWVVRVDSNVVRGEGNRLDAADSLFQSISKETTVIIGAIVEMPSGKLRNLSGSWKVGTFLREEKE